MSVVEPKVYASTAPQAAQAPDGITVLGVQFASIASLFGPLHDRADMAWASSRCQCGPDRTAGEFGLA
jgi:hypothetical protein